MVNFSVSYSVVDKNQEDLFDWLKSCNRRYMTYKCNGKLCYFNDILLKISETRSIINRNVVTRLFEQINQDENSLMANQVNYIVIRNNHYYLPFYIFKNETIAPKTVKKYTMYVDC